MFKKQILGIVVVFLSIGLCLSFAQPSHSATIVNFEAFGATLDVATISYSILAPAGATTISTGFAESWQAGWTDFSSGNFINGNDLAGANSATSGVIGTFAETVILGGWILGNQSAVTLNEGTDYQVLELGTNYLITGDLNAVPIPGSILLLGSGLVGLIGIARRKRS